MYVNTCQCLYTDICPNVHCTNITSMYINVSNIHKHIPMYGNVHYTSVHQCMWIIQYQHVIPMYFVDNVNCGLFPSRNCGDISTSSACPSVLSWNDIPPTVGVMSTQPGYLGWSVGLRPGLLSHPGCLQLGLYLQPSDFSAIRDRNDIPIRDQ